MEKLFANKIIRIIFQILPVLTAIFIILLALSGAEFSVDTLLLYIPQNYFLAIIFLLLLYIIKSVSVFFPIIILYVAAGSILPPIPAILFNIVGTSVCMTIAYWIGFSTNSTSAAKLLYKYPKLEAIIRIQQNNEWFISYFLRVLNFLPVEIVSMYLGSLKITFYKYLISSVLGVLPGIILCTLIGISITDPTSWVFILSVSISIALTLFSILIYKRIKKKQRTEDN